MAETYEVTSSALREHASGVSGLADELRGAFDLAGHVRLTDDVYGEPGRQVATLLNDVAQAAGGTIRAAIAALDSAATNLRGSAEDYTAREGAETQRFSGIAGELE